jgi:hypothetical protein
MRYLPRGLGQNPSLGDEDDVLAGELLLQLADKPGLDLLEGLELRHGHEDDDGALAGHLDLLGRRDVELAELGLQVGVDLQLEQSLRNGLLELIWLFLRVGLDNLGAGSERHLKHKSRVYLVGLNKVEEFLMKLSPAPMISSGFAQ